MKGGILLLVMVSLFAVGGCKKPAEGTTYVPPPTPTVVKKGKMRIANNGYNALNVYVNGIFEKRVPGGTYIMKEVVPGSYSIKGVQAEGYYDKPLTVGTTVTVVSEGLVLVNF
ncbi:MAG: hypothetical protein V4649_16145 [Bacteroidota bacterium]